jgi:hypothetical protein
MVHHAIQQYKEVADMDLCRWRGPFLVKQPSPGAISVVALPGYAALAALIALALLMLGAVTAPGHARAAGGGAKIVFTSPIYPGQNNGSAEGPVGAQVNVQGSGWTPNATVNITLADMQNDTQNQPGSACQNGATLITAETTQADSSGNVTATFLWPTGAGAKNHSYWACGDQGSTPSVGVSFYTVLSANPPSAQINVSQAMAGSMITVTGQNWLPGNQQIQVTIAPSITGQPPYSSQATTTAAAGGTFSVSVEVPPQAPVGTKLYVSVQNIDNNNPGNTGALHTEPTNTPTFTVIASPTATPSPTNTSTPTATSTSTATATGTAGTGSGGNNGSGNGGSPGTSADTSGNGLLIVLLAALGGVLLLAAVVAILLFVRSRAPATGMAGGGGYSGYGGGYSQYNPPRRPGRRPTNPAYPAYPDTNMDYYDGPQQGGLWDDDPQGPDDEGFGDAPTIGPGRPWR